MKTKEELNKLKDEYNTLTNKLKELTEDELNMVVGGFGGDTIEVGLWYGKHIPLVSPNSYTKLYYYCDKVLGNNLYSFIEVAYSSFNGYCSCEKVGEKQSDGKNLFKTTVPLEVEKCIS